MSLTFLWKFLILQTEIVLPATSLTTANACDKSSNNPTFWFQHWAKCPVGLGQTLLHFVTDGDILYRHWNQRVAADSETLVHGFTSGPAVCISQDLPPHVDFARVINFTHCHPHLYFQRTAIRMIIVNDVSTTFQHPAVTLSSSIVCCAPEL